MNMQKNSVNFQFSVVDFVFVILYNCKNTIVNVISLDSIAQVMTKDFSVICIETENNLWFFFSFIVFVFSNNLEYFAFQRNEKLLKNFTTLLFLFTCIVDRKLILLLLNVKHKVIKSS